jgi:hypothetical protein
MTVVEINGDWFVAEIVVGPFPDNAEAWRWVDRSSQQRESRRDRPAYQATAQPRRQSNERIND